MKLPWVHLPSRPLSLCNHRPRQFLLFLPTSLPFILFLRLQTSFPLRVGCSIGCSPPAPSACQWKWAISLFLFKDLIVDHHGERRDGKKLQTQGIYRYSEPLVLSLSVQKLLVEGAWCLSKLMRIGLCWLHFEICRWFVKAWMTCSQ